MKLIVLALTLAACSNTDAAKANASAREYIKAIPGAMSVSCADVDSDDDGYVSCTVFREHGDPLPIQCGSERYCINCASGCKYTPFAGGSKAAK